MDGTTNMPGEQLTNKRYSFYEHPFSQTAPCLGAPDEVVMQNKIISTIRHDCTVYNYFQKVPQR